jgi:glycosyltransferase involved in cell wall biosynthesis
MEQHAQDLLEGLMEKGHRVSVITTPLPKTPALKPLEPNGNVVQLPGGLARYSPATFWSLKSAVMKLHQQVPVDLIHCQGFMGIPLSWGRSNKQLPPVVHSIHGTLFSETPLHPLIFSQLSLVQKAKACWRFKHRLLFWPLWELFLRSNPHLITDSVFSQILVERNGMRPATVIPLGISPEVLPVLPASTRMLLVARLEKIKNADFAINLLEQLPQEIALDVVGEGPQRVRLEQFIQEKNLQQRVKLWGRLSTAELNTLRQQALVLLNPDGGHPAFGLVNAEALYQGVPVITTPHGAHAEVVNTAREGAVLSLSKPERWAAEIMRIAQEDFLQLREERAVRNRARFNRNLMVEKVLNLYQGFLNNSE